MALFCIKVLEIETTIYGPGKKTNAHLRVSVVIIIFAKDLKLIQGTITTTGSTGVFDVLLYSLLRCFCKSNCSRVLQMIVSMEMVSGSTMMAYASTEYTYVVLDSAFVAPNWHSVHSMAVSG